MKHTAKLLLKYARNGIVSLRHLKQQNYYLFKVVLSNLAVVRDTLKRNGIEIIDDLVSWCNPETIRYYLQYYYGDTVNLTDLRTAHPAAYKYLSQEGKPYEHLRKLGFNVIYNNTMSEEELVATLASRNENGKVKLDRSLYLKLFYRASLKGLDIESYVQQLGFQIEKIDDNLLLYLKDVEGKSFYEIAKIMQVPKSTLHRRYQKLKQEGGINDPCRKGEGQR
ncbi:hypothetical protein E308F_30830 [Moorella sp. E308F]|uniref:hypothetical protein n=1 Tax=Moorella sp. E308F TaxID=2572682 RepID=UPI0010FFB55C|nr:hypothetical protein [Moorella sp. E308F]GEA16837.1 hypothetical protein E308F_30830 [Moorella sp. E308F]